MRRDAGSGFRRGLERTGLALGCGCALFAALFVVCGVKLSEPEINGFVGLFHAGKLELTGKHISRYSEEMCIRDRHWTASTTALPRRWPRRRRTCPASGSRSPRWKATRCV